MYLYIHTALPICIYFCFICIFISPFLCIFTLYIYVSFQICIRINCSQPIAMYLYSNSNTYTLFYPQMHSPMSNNHSCFIQVSLIQFPFVSIFPDNTHVPIFIFIYFLLLYAPILAYPYTCVIETSCTYHPNCGHLCFPTTSSMETLNNDVISIMQ